MLLPATYFISKQTVRRFLLSLLCSSYKYSSFTGCFERVYLTVYWKKGLRGEKGQGYLINKNILLLNTSRSGRVIESYSGRIARIYYLAIIEFSFRRI